MPNHPQWISIRDDSDPFSKLPALADRLGVKELSSTDKGGRWVAQTKSGSCYDIFDLINAVLDKIDKAS